MQQSLNIGELNLNCIHYEISSLNSWNVCYQSVQNLLSFQLLMRNVKIEMYETTVTFCFVWM
jgi:hypothetical protein